MRERGRGGQKRYRAANSDVAEGWLLPCVREIAIGGTVRERGEE